MRGHVQPVHSDKLQITILSFARRRISLNVRYVIVAILWQSSAQIATNCHKVGHFAHSQDIHLRDEYRELSGVYSDIYKLRSTPFCNAENNGLKILNLQTRVRFPVALPILKYPCNQSLNALFRKPEFLQCARFCARCKNYFVY